jgi:hypothetical protein
MAQRNTPDINKILRTPYWKGYSERGADMGRKSDTDGITEEPLYLQRMRMVDCGAYDAGGAYWGCGQPIYAAFNEGGETRGPTIFATTRARNRAEAKKLFEEQFPGITWRK